ncbi:unnamed protein product [Adineta ricciae]|uniref:PDZ domain-containing protein n=1 Tax=Adineta ricciae TaxID=249248 RepID=A0A814M7J6_ADIRI|nr:unnamed protein product [Adineta ricciae]CAF1075474.1 unnamed protein product [Adineta ricciae]
MAAGPKKLTMQGANLRACRLYTWTGFNGLGFDLKTPSTAPHEIALVESNSPAAAGGLKIGDIILAVNGKDTIKAKYTDFTKAINKARAKKGPVELRVMEKRYYDEVVKQKIKINPKEARVIEAPQAQPADQANFPQKERICDVRLTDATQSFGFELVNGDRNIGVFIQEVSPNTPASIAGLRKSDRVIKVDGELVDDKPSQLSYDRIREAKKNLAVKLLVMDTKTYKNYKKSGPPPSAPAPMYENLTSGGKRQTDDESEPDDRTPTSPPPASDQYETPGIHAIVPKPSSSYPTTTAAPRDDSSDDETSPAYVSTSPKPSSGIGAVVHAHPVVPGAAGKNLPPNRRRCELRRDRTLGYGFTTDYDGSNEYKHKIIDITANSPADKKGLRKNDYILTIDDTIVQNMNKTEFTSFMRSSGSAAESSDRPLVLQVINEDQLRSRSPSTRSEPIEPPKVTTSEVYPELRRCIIRRSAKYPDFGFQVDQSSNTYSGAAGFQIKHLKSNSPADRTNIENYDYIIEVNGKNVENDELEDLRDNIRDIYKNKNNIELVVIDEIGYRWYKTRHYPIDPNSAKAKVTRYVTPASPQSSRKSSISTDPPTTSRPIVQPSTYETHIHEPPQRDDTDNYRPSHHEDKSTKPPGKQVDLTTSPDANSGMTSGSGQRNQYTTTTAGQLPSSGTGYPQSQYHNGTSSSQLVGQSTSRPPSRANVIDLMSEKGVLRYYNLSNEQREPWGFRLDTHYGKHVITNVKPNSLAASAGLKDHDCIIEVDSKSVEDKPNSEVLHLLRSASVKGKMSLLVAPHLVYQLRKNSETFFQKTNEESFYSNIPSQFNNGLSSARRDDIINLSHEPSDPLPRKCLLFRDSPSNKKCGFEVLQKEGYETPIVSKVYADSPAKKSGLTEGDHIVAVQSINVQKFKSVDDVVDRIRRYFYETGEVELLVLTGPAFQVLKRRGGNLIDQEFDYQSQNDKSMQPRLLRLDFQPDEYMFGLSFRRENSLYISEVEPGSSAYCHGVKPGDIVLEINGQDVKYTSVSEIKALIEESKQKRGLDILLIDFDGYKYSVEHAIPLNSLLPFVRKRKGSTSDNIRHTMYL